MKRKLNVAMIGHRFMGKAHSNAWRQVSRFFDVPIDPVMKVICGRDEAGVKSAADKYGWLEHSTSWRQVVERKDIDVIDICTPGDLHMPIAVAAAEARKAIFCEKPLANTVAEAERMLVAASGNSCIHMLCHNYRRAPAVMLAKQLVEGGRIGKPYHYRGSYLQDWLVDPEFPRVWRLEKARAGSGALGDLVSHSADLARFFLGEINEVAAALRTFITERPLRGSEKKAPVEVDDAAISLIKFENGAIGTIEASRLAPGHKNHLRFEINGSKGSVAFDLERLNELELYIDEGPNSGFKTILVTESGHPYIQSWWPPGHIIGYEHTFIHTVYDLLRAIDKDEIPTPNFEDGVRNQKILDALERASSSGRWETV